MAVRAPIAHGTEPAAANGPDRSYSRPRRIGLMVWANDARPTRPSAAALAEYFSTVLRDVVMLPPCPGRAVPGPVGALRSAAECSACPQGCQSPAVDGR